MEGERERHAFQQLQQEHQESRQRGAENVQAIPARLLEEVTACDITRHLYTDVTLVFVSLAMPSRAAERPRVGADSQTIKLWTNDDLETLHDLGLICIVGQINEETPKPASLPQPYMKTRDPEWYAEQAARLRDELERRRAQLDGYRQAIEEATSLMTMAGGINLDAVR